MPRFSIILPTYNRRDTILRAVDSVRAQTFGDYELLITDDGSTDGTAELLEGLDPRISVARQPNAGMAPARNAALRRSRGEYIAFLDSDDEWLPHYLELSHAFFEANPKEHLFSGEFWIDYGTGEYEKHFRASMDWFLPTAKRIGLGGLSLPADETDDYLRFYSTRSEVGEWGRNIVEKLPYEGVYQYSGDIFEHFRHGYLLAAQSTVVSRQAFERIGLFDTTYPAGCDFGWLAVACREYRAHMVSVPACIKHEYAAKGQKLAEGHVATGASGLQFAKDLLRWHETLFWNDKQNDKELSALRAWAQLYVGRIELDRGLTQDAIQHLSAAVTACPGPEARLLLLAAKSLPPSAARSFSGTLFQSQAKYARIQRRVRNMLSRRQQAPESSSSQRKPAPDDPSGIRPFQSSDLPDLMKVRAATHGENSIFNDPAYFSWIYVQRPLAIGKPSDLWLHQSATGPIDGQVGTAPVPLSIGGVEHDACWVFDLAVDKATRGRGTASSLIGVACARSKAAMALEVSGGGRQVLMRAGWSDLGDLTLYVRPIDASVMARRLIAKASALGAVGNAVLASTAEIASASAKLLGLKVREIARFDGAVDEIWEMAKSAYPVVVRRDGRFLNWRFADFPERGRYRLFYFSKGGVPVGYAVLRVGEHHGAKAGYVVDFFCEPKWTYGILAHSVQRLRREKVAAVYCLHSNPVSTAPLLALGFIPRQSGWPLVADLRRLPGDVKTLAADPGNWFITGGDGDVDRPGERIVAASSGATSEAV